MKDKYYDEKLAEVTISWLVYFNLSRNAVLVTSRNPHNGGILSRGPAKVGGGGGVGRSAMSFV